MFGNDSLRYYPNWQTNNFYGDAIRDLCDYNTTIPSAVLNYIARTYKEHDEWMPVTGTETNVPRLKPLSASGCTVSTSKFTLTLSLCLVSHDEQFFEKHTETQPYGYLIIILYSQFKFTRWRERVQFQILSSRLLSILIYPSSVKDLTDAYESYKPYSLYWFWFNKLIEWKL